MYLVRSLRTFIGTEEERTNAGLAAFLAGDEYIEVDESGVPTGLEYIHTGMAWLLNSSAGSPGGSNTQIQLNDDGVFGASANLTFNPITNQMLVGGSVAAGVSSALEVHDSITDMRFNVVNDSASNSANLTNVGFYLKNDAEEFTLSAFWTAGLADRTDGSEDSYLTVGLIRNGLNAITTYFGASQTYFNYNSDNIDTIIYGASESFTTMVDAGENAFQVGFLTPGNIVDFRYAGIVFNNGENDINFRIAGNGVTDAYFYDAGLNRHGFGTGTPGAFVYLDNTETSGTPETGLTVDNTYSPGSDPGSVFPTSLSLLADYDSSVTPSGGFVLAQFLRARNVGNGVMSARCLDIQFQNLGTGTTPFFTGVNVRTPTNSGGGAITTAYGLKVENQNIAGTNYAIYTDAGTIRFGGGVILGAPTGGDKGAGTMNVATNIYKNNTAYTNPDYALEHWVTGSIKRFVDREGAQDYYRLSLDESEQFVRKNLHLPRISRDPAGIFDMADMALEKIEEAHIYIYELHNRIKVLEQRLADGN